MTLGESTMEPTNVNLGGSLLVPCVQELSKVIKTDIPDRYIRSDQDLVITDPSGSSIYEIPVIDMHKLLDQESMESEIAMLDIACKEWGFFQLINHGVDILLLEKIKKEVQEFFDLPIDEKKKFWQYTGEIEGFGQAFVVSEEQKLDWADIFFMTTRPVNMRKPHLFPKLPLPFRDTLDYYSLEIENLAKAILGHMAKAIKMKKEEMEGLFEALHQSIRMNYYPPCVRPDQVIGLTPHSDAIGLTILLHVNEVEGLQVKKDGKWVPVKPLPNAFVINVGDILEMITNGIYRSIEHRATINSGKERLSIATFHSPGLSREIGPAHSLISEQTPAAFKRIGVQEYFKGLFARELEGKTYLDSMRV